MYKVARNTCIAVLVLVLILMYGGSAITKISFSRPVDIYQDRRCHLLLHHACSGRRRALLRGA